MLQPIQTQVAFDGGALSLPLAHYVSVSFCVSDTTSFFVSGSFFVLLSEHLVNLGAHLHAYLGVTLLPAQPRLSTPGHASFLIPGNELPPSCSFPLILFV